MRYDAIIIGSGVTGMTAALVLAQNGKRVAMVEKGRHIAPLIRRFKRGRVWCDPGFHYTGGLEEGGTLTVLFRYLRMRNYIRAMPMDAEGYDILYRDGRRMPIPCGMDNVMGALCDYFPGSSGAAKAYIEKVDSIMKATPFVNFDLEYADFQRKDGADLSLGSFLAGVGAEEGLKDLLGHYGRFLYGVSGDEVPFYIHALIMGSFYRSAYTLADGGDGIVDAFERRLREEGVDIYCDSPAVGLKVGHDRRLHGVVTAGNGVLESANCISTMHPALLAEILPHDSIRPAYISRLASLENTNGVLAAWFDVQRVPENISSSNHYHICDDEYGSIGVMSCGPEQDGSGKKGLCVLQESLGASLPREWCRAGRRVSEYVEYKQRGIEHLLTRLLELHPEITGGCRVACGATSFTYERYTGTPCGSMYGVRQSMDQIRLNTMTSIRGLYLAGQSVLMPGVMGCVISGFLAAAHIMDLKTLWNGVRQWR